MVDTVLPTGWQGSTLDVRQSLTRTLEAGLDRIRDAPTIPAAVRASWDLDRELDARAGATGVDRLVGTLRRATRDEHDGVLAIAAVHAMARLPGSTADAELRAIVVDDVPGLATHALWAIRRRPSGDLVTTLAQRIARGGLEGAHAQGLLARWGAETRFAAAGLDALVEQARRTSSPGSRRRIVETMGLIPGRRARDLLVRHALDEGEDLSVRRTAVAAFAERTAERLPSPLVVLATRADTLGDAIRLVRAQRSLIRRGPRRSREPGEIRVAQVHLGAVLDAEVSRAGMGDAGGVATLLSRLGVVLAEQPSVAEVISIGRGIAGHVMPGVRASGGHRFEAVPLEDAEGSGFSGSWPGLVAARRGIRAALLATHAPDVVHLRMADPGSLAAADVAHELAIPVVFTLAPDPHGPIAAAERAGALDRRRFASADAREHLWFRMQLVDRLARQARGVVLFPRSDLARQLRTLVGVDIAAGPPRFTVAPEGVDTRAADRARQAVASPEVAAEPALSDLLAGIASLPAERQGLPLVMSVGRLNELKGMARIVRAFGSDEALSERANLVIVGGDLERPTAVEAEELKRIRAEFDAHPGLSDRVILLGHRPNDQVGLLLAVARHGLDPLVGPCGAYVCGSLKEEFGLAIVEAMAAGLPVVAPRDGGPVTYVEEGITGALVDTADPAAIAHGLRSALELSRVPRTAARSRDVVERGFTLDRMARALVAVYRTAVTPDSRSASVVRDAAA